MNLEFHPLANIFPLMSEAEISDLAEDIKKNGLAEPIFIYEGKILDGRNRYLACEKVNIKPDTINYNGKDPLGWVISLNLKRRHLSESQRGMIAAKIANMDRGGDKKSDQSANLRKDKISQPEAAKKLNVSERTIQDAKAILRKAPEKVKDIESGKKTIHQVKREIRKKEALENIPKTPEGKYRIIYADPPWKYGDTMAGLDKDGYGIAAEKHYPSMSIQELCDLPVSDWTDKNSVLFLWVTSPMLEDSFRVIRAWGFEYKTSFIWDKIKHNMGHYNSVRHELLLICVKGSCTPDNPKLFDSVQSIERSKEHSEKPEEFREIIATLYPNGRRLEMFARKKSKGWEVYGTEVS